LVGRDQVVPLSPGTCLLSTDAPAGYRMGCTVTPWLCRNVGLSDLGPHIGAAANRERLPGNPARS